MDTIIVEPAVIEPDTTALPEPIIDTLMVEEMMMAGETATTTAITNE